jgi:hypothetical protein
MDQAIAAYVLKVAEAAANTHTAADRPLYEKYLADASVLLAQAVAGAPASELAPLVRAHDRLLGITWLQGPEHQSIFAAWQGVIDQAPDARAI